jgi:hypothetical protein
LSFWAAVALARPAFLLDSCTISLLKLVSIIIDLR